MNLYTLCGPGGPLKNAGVHMHDQKNKEKIKGVFFQQKTCKAGKRSGL